MQTHVPYAVKAGRSFARMTKEGPLLVAVVARRVTRWEGGSYYWTVVAVERNVGPS